MPILYQQEIDTHTRLAIWKIEELESFFDVPLERSIRHPHKRLQHLAGRYLLKYLFADFPIGLIKIADTRKPFLEDEAYHFSISHCGDFAAAIASKHSRVGIDIEVPSDKLQRIREKFLHPEELQLAIVNWQLATDKLQTTNYKLSVFWSCKEAIFKWWSYGNVDFSEMIRLHNVPEQDSGIIKASFIHEQKSIPLAVRYKVFNGLTLAWVEGNISEEFEI